MKLHQRVIKDSFNQFGHALKYGIIFCVLKLKNNSSNKQHNK
jgi:hypothetical protein